MSRASSHEDGYVTAELAACMPVLITVLLAGMVAVSAVSAQIHCVDAAREAALAAARGEDGASAAASALPDNGDLTIDTSGDRVTVEATAAVELPGSMLPAIPVGGQATAALEPGVSS